VIAIAVAATHWPALSARATFFDDQQYLDSNRLVQDPSWHTAGRFLGEVLEPSTVRGYYQPLAMISLMLDYAMGGRVDDPTQFRRTSLALHVINTAMVLLLLYLLFGQAWPAAMAALLYGLHPVTIESMPWLAERKTLLAAFFSLGCLVFYVMHVRRGGWKFYTACLAAYVLALMSKPTSTPLPVLLILLDFWPLRRLSRRSVVEKLPLFVIGGVFALITVVSQGRTANMAMPQELPLIQIPLIICHNIVFYLFKIVWPANLSWYYPFPQPFTASQPMVLVGLVGTALLLGGLVISLRRTRAAMTGWLFFFVAIFPTMGVVGFTVVIAADRFVYLPAVGLLLPLTCFLALLWAPKTGSSQTTVRRVAMVGICLVLAAAEAVATRSYLQHWKNTGALHRYTLALAPDAAPLHSGLGCYLLEQKEYEDAAGCFRRAIELQPDDADFHANLGSALARQGKHDQAIVQYRISLEIRPTARAHAGLANSLDKKGQIDQAIAHYNEALRIDPGLASARSNLANILARQHNSDLAIMHYNEAIRARPDYAEGYVNLGAELHEGGRIDEAIEQYRRALEIDPNLAMARSNLGLALHTQGKIEEAIEEYRKALRIDPGYVDTYLNLGTGLGQLGLHDESLKAFDQAVRVDPTNAQAHFKLAGALEALGRAREAADHYRMTLRLNPQHTEARSKLAAVQAGDSTQSSQ
jgi:tetratricopeptide (TPR) repeat protein